MIHKELQAYNNLKTGRTCSDFYIGGLFERIKQERLIKEVEKEQEETRHKNLITAIQKLNVKSISHFDYPSQTYSYCDRVRLEPIITYEICNKCNGSGKGRWWQKCEKCKGKIFVKLGPTYEEKKSIIPKKQLEKFV